MSTVNETEVSAQQVIDLLLSNWENRVNAITIYFNQHESAFYQQQVAPGRNRAIYILGHLAASNDGLNILLGVGSRQLTEYDVVFHSTPDDGHMPLPELEEVKTAWIRVNESLLSEFKKMSSVEWLQRHSNVSEDDFKKEPQRNKLNVLISRLTHLGYHLGQLMLLKAGA